MFKSKIYNKILVEGNRRVLMEKQDLLEMFNDVFKLYSVALEIMKDISEESPNAKYFQMLKDTAGLHFSSFVKTQVSEVKSTCVRGPEMGDPPTRRPAPDMALWCLRYYKVADFLRLITIVDQVTAFAEELSPQEQDVCNRVRKLCVDAANGYIFKVTKNNENFKEFSLSANPTDDEVTDVETKVDAVLTWIKNKLFHYISMVGISEVQNYRFENQWWTDVERTFAEAEAAWQTRQDKLKGTIPVQDALPFKVVLSFPDGKYWALLDRPSCNQEGGAMGHCGNNYGNMESTDKILSLRENMEVPVTDRSGNEQMVPSIKPYLTFILRQGGLIGEAKARFNAHPGQMFHPYIMALLKEPFIKGFRDGGHAPEANFRLKDLTPEETKQMQAARPDLYGLTPKAQEKPVEKPVQEPAMQESRRHRLDKKVKTR